MTRTKKDQRLLDDNRLTTQTTDERFKTTDERLKTTDDGL